MPFAGQAGSTAGGRLALALLNGLIAATLAALGQRYAGRLGLLLPFAVYFGSVDFLGRMIRLRPETLALLLFFAAAFCAAKSRYRLLGLVTLLFALSYTAIHALVGLCGLWFLVRGLSSRRWEWPLLLYPVLGAGLGLLVHPHFPHNLVVWKVQSVDFFRLMNRADVGTEILAASPGTLLVNNVGWLAALVALSLASPHRAKDESSRFDEQWERNVWLTAAIVFAVLYLRMQRFSTYCIPFVSVAVLATRRKPLWALAPRLSRLRWAAVVTSAAIAVVSTIEPARTMWGLATASGGPLHREADWAAAGRTLPPGAKVAADWGITPNLLFYAPQAQYLNVLDPVFMLAPYPDEYEAWRKLFAGRATDIPTVLHEALDSDYLVLSRFQTPPRFLAQLQADPQMQLLYAGYTLVYRVRDSETLPLNRTPTGNLR